MLSYIQVFSYVVSQLAVALDCLYFHAFDALHIWQGVFPVYTLHALSDGIYRLLSDFKKTLQQWKACDDITIIEKHQSIRDYLINLWQHGLQVCLCFISCSSSFDGQVQPDPYSHPESLLRKLLTLDDIGLSTQVALLLDDKAKYKQVLGQCGPSAQALLNLLQAVCQWQVITCVFLTWVFLQQHLNFPVNSIHKPHHVKALIKLSRASKLYPECIILKGVNLQGNPVAGGAYGDVYKGHIEGQILAVKVLKVYEMSERDKLLKVT